MPLSLNIHQSEVYFLLKYEDIIKELNISNIAIIIYIILICSFSFLIFFSIGLDIGL